MVIVLDTTLTTHSKPEIDDPPSICDVTPQQQPNHNSSASSRDDEEAKCPSVGTISVLACGELGCDVVFSGNYRQGNLQRHKRFLHRKNPVAYPCTDSNCHRSFKRSDARLKHYRKCHAHSAPKPIEHRQQQRHMSHMSKVLGRQQYHEGPNRVQQSSLNSDIESVVNISIWSSSPPRAAVVSGSHMIPQMSLTGTPQDISTARKEIPDTHISESNKRYPTRSSTQSSRPGPAENPRTVHISRLPAASFGKERFSLQRLPSPFADTGESRRSERIQRTELRERSGMSKCRGSTISKDSISPSSPGGLSKKSMTSKKCKKQKQIMRKIFPEGLLASPYCFSRADTANTSR